MMTMQGTTLKSRILAQPVSLGSDFIASNMKATVNELWPVIRRQVGTA
jgi:hypothetical protein